MPTLPRPLLFIVGQAIRFNLPQNLLCLVDFYVHMSTLPCLLLCRGGELALRSTFSRRSSLHPRLIMLACLLCLVG